jgi:Trypsin
MNAACRRLGAFFLLTIATTTATAREDQAVPEMAGGKTTIVWPAAGAVLGTGTGATVCSAVLIAPRWVLGAAHCGGDITSTFRVGFNAFSGSGSYAVAAVIPDPDYQGGTSHDIQLLQLADAVPITPFLLSDGPPPTYVSPGFAAPLLYAIGYGFHNDGPLDLNRRLSVLPIGTAPPQLGLASDLMYFSANAAHPCGGDSGGPVFDLAPNGFPVVYATMDVLAATPLCSQAVDSVGVRIDQVLAFITQHVTDACLASQPRSSGCDGIFASTWEPRLNP